VVGVVVPIAGEHSVARGVRKKLLKNYKSWCSYLGKKPHVYVPSGGCRVQGSSPCPEIPRTERSSEGSWR
jgi:hypothetical protein